MNLGAVLSAELKNLEATEEQYLRLMEKAEFEGRIYGGFPPYSYEWDFGDRETSTSAYPIHAYKSAGSYTVSLKVTDDRGNTNTWTRDDYILVRPGWSAGSIATAAWSGFTTY